MRAINLRTEHMINPIGIDSKEPYLSWNCEDGRRQTAYQIVAMDENGVVWDSSRVESGQYACILSVELKSDSGYSGKYVYGTKRRKPVSGVRKPFLKWGCQIKLTGGQNGSIQSLNVIRRHTNQRVI